MPYSEVSVGWRGTAFADTQTALTSGVTYLPDAADAFRFVSFSVDPKAPFGPRQDAHGRPGRRGQIAQHKTCSFSLELYATGGGATGTAPDWVNLLTAGGWQVSGGGGDTTILGGGSSTTVLDVDDASGISAGDAVVVGTQIRRVTATTSGVPDTVTVTPALSSAPSSGTTVGHALTYTMNPDRASAGNELTLWRFDNRTADMLIGAVVTSITFAITGGDEMRVTLEGRAAQWRRMISTTLSSGINDSVTTIPLTDGSAIPDDVSASAPVYMQVGSEVLEIIAISGNSATSSARGVYGTGGAAASHSSGAEVYPYQPTGTFVDVNPIPRTTGELVVGGDTFQHESAQLSCDLGVRFTENSHGQNFDIDHYTLNAYDIQTECVGSSYYDEMVLVSQEAIGRDQIQVFAQAGNTAGSMIAFDSPSTGCEVAAFATARDDEMTVTLTGHSHQQSGADLSEVYLMIG